MTSLTQPTSEQQHTGSRWYVWLALASAIAFIVGIVVAILNGGTSSLVDESSDAVTYFVIFALIAGDAVIPILPGETVLNAASVRAADGELELILVIIAGSLGAIVGDNALYWISRKLSSRFASQLDRAEQDNRVQTVVSIVGDRAPLFIVLGRYVPGVRFFVNASMGAQHYPYRKFLLWSTIGGTLWATYTSILAYAVGSTLDEYPLASVLVSGAITTAIIGVIFWHEKGKSAGARPASVAD